MGIEDLLKKMEERTKKCIICEQDIFVNEDSVPICDKCWDEREREELEDK